MKYFMTEVCENCKPLFEKLLKRIEELERRLAAYENAHTPYSHKIFMPRPKAINGKRGRPKGFEGSTRPIPKPDRTIEKKFSRCPNCDNELKHLYKESMVVEEIPKPQPIVVTEFINNHYECKNCGEVVAKDENCPEKGRFGNNVLAHCTLMKPEEQRYRAMTMFVGEDRFVESDSRRVNLATDFTQQELETLRTKINIARRSTV